MLTDIISVTDDSALCDPLGSDLGIDPATLPPPPQIADPLLQAHYGDITNYSTGCVLDGVRFNCDFIQNLVNSGGGIEAPWDNTRSVWNSVTRQNELARFTVDWDNGFYGFVPVGATYGGDGKWSWNRPRGSQDDDEESDGRLNPLQQAPVVLPEVSHRSVSMVATLPPPILLGQHCGINPVTGSLGINAVASGKLGELRSGIGGNGAFHSRGGHHQGIDVRAPVGTVIYTNRDGKVLFNGWAGGYGNSVIIEHDSNAYTLYAHLQFSGFFRVGETVNQGDDIGLAGRTGNPPKNQLETEDHLHFGFKSTKMILRRGAIFDDPVTYLNSDCELPPPPPPRNRRRGRG